MQTLPRKPKFEARLVVDPVTGFAAVDLGLMRRP
jgi:hypothetical protein